MKTVLRTDVYDGDDDGAWVLLEAVAEPEVAEAEVAAGLAGLSGVRIE